MTKSTRDEISGVTAQRYPHPLVESKNVLPFKSVAIAVSDDLFVSKQNAAAKRKLSELIRGRSDHFRCEVRWSPMQRESE